MEEENDELDELEDVEMFQELKKLIEKQYAELKEEINKLKEGFKKDEQKEERKKEPIKYRCAGCGRGFTETEFRTLEKCPTCGSSEAVRI